MPQNAKVTAFTVSELFKENQQREVTLPPPPPKLRLRDDLPNTSSLNFRFSTPVVGKMMLRPCKLYSFLRLAS